MPDVRIGLERWPPDADDPIGEGRAQELVQRLRDVVTPVVDAAEEDLRTRIGPSAEVTCEVSFERWYSDARSTLD